MAVTFDDVVELYVAILGRAPEQGGLYYWYNVANSQNLDKGQLAKAIFDAAVQTVNQNIAGYQNIYPAYVGVDPSNLTFGQAKAIVDQMYQNMFSKDSTIDPGGVSYWTNLIVQNPSNIGQIIAGIIAAAYSSLDSTDPNVAPYVHTFANRVEAAKQISDMVLDLPHGVNDVAFLKSVNLSVTNDKQTIDNAVNLVNKNNLSVPGYTYDLTPNTDNMTGTPYNDTFNATAGTLNNSDKLDGNGGYDKLNATINADVTPAQIKNIQNIDLTFNSNATFGMDNVTDVKKLTVDAKDADANSYSPIISNISNTNINTTLKNLSSIAAFIFTDNALSGSNDTFNLHLESVNNGAIAIQNADSTSTNGLETLNLYSEGDATNTISSLLVNPLKNLNISGTQDLTISNTVVMADNGVVDASGLNANDNLILSTTGTTMTVKGGAGDDNIAVLGVKNLTADLGAGDDTINNSASATPYDNVTANLGDGNNNGTFNLSATGTANITGGAGNDNITVDGGKNITINAGDGANTINIGGTTAPADDATINITGGAGVDNVTVTLTNGTKTATVNIDTGAGDDQITVNSGDSKDSVTIKAGAGNDIIDLDTGSYAGAAKIYGGAGKDDITLAATHAASTIVLTKDDLSTAPTADNTGDFDMTKVDTITNFTTGTGNDTIDLSALFTNLTENSTLPTIRDTSSTTYVTGGVYYNTSVSLNSPTLANVKSIFDTGAIQAGNENIFIADDENNDYIYIFYFKDANGNAHIDANEIKLVAVVSGVTDIHTNIT